MLSFFSILGALALIAAPAQAADAFKLESKALMEGGVMGAAQVYKGFGCSGGNISPDLSWSGAPEGTRYFAVTAFDPDAPTGSGWWHWLVVNLPASVTSLEAGTGSVGGKLPPEALQTRTDFGQSGYGGACPPVGDPPHRYIFTVYALKDKVPVEAGDSGAMVAFNLRTLKLAEASITVTYGR